MEIADQTIEAPGDLPSGVNLWMVTPNYGNATFRSKKGLEQLVSRISEKSEDNADLVVWIGIRNFGSESFWYPKFEGWSRHGVIASGSGERMKIGVVFTNMPLKTPANIARFRKHKWGAKIIWSETGGAKCSQTCQMILKKISGDNRQKLVCDPYAASPTLAILCRRMNMVYRGYTEYQGVRSKIEKELAQVELPGIQEELPLLMKNGE